MIQNNYNYSNSSPYFGSKLDAETIKQIKSVSSPGLENCIDALAERIQSWGNDKFVISLEKIADGREQFFIKNSNNNSEKIGLSMPRKSNELIHAFIMITRKMIISAEKHLSNNK